LGGSLVDVESFIVRKVGTKRMILRTTADCKQVEGKEDWIE